MPMASCTSYRSTEKYSVCLPRSCDLRRGSCAARVTACCQHVMSAGERLVYRGDMRYFAIAVVGLCACSSRSVTPGVAGGVSDVRTVIVAEDTRVALGAM